MLSDSLKKVWTVDLPALVVPKQHRSPEFLVSAYTAEGPVIFHVRGRRVFGPIERGIIGYGTERNKELLNRLHKSSLPMQQAVLLAIYLVSQSKKIDSDVGGPTRIVIVRDSGAWIEHQPYIDNAEGRIGDFLRLTDDLFLSSVDLSIAPSRFPAIVEEFGAKAIKLREQFLQESAAIVLNRVFSDPTYRGDPYAKIFPGASVSLPANGPMVVHEDMPEELAKRTQLYKIMHEKHNELANQQFNAMIAGRDALYLGQEWVHVRGSAGPLDTPEAAS